MILVSIVHHCSVVVLSVFNGYAVPPPTKKNKRFPEFLCCCLCDSCHCRGVLGVAMCAWSLSCLLLGWWLYDYYNYDDDHSSSSSPASVLPALTLLIVLLSPHYWLHCSVAFLLLLVFFVLVVSLSLSLFLLMLLLLLLMVMVCVAPGSCCKVQRARSNKKNAKDPAGYL